MARKRVFLFDGNNLLFRAHFALIRNPLRNSRGMETSGVFGFINMFLNVLKEERPDYVAVAFDKSRNTFRREIYAEYKAQRKPTPDALKAQFPLAYRFVELQKVPVLASDRFEADDIIGTLARRFSAQDVDVIMVSGDRDLLQLVNERTKLRLLKSGVKEVVDYDPARIMTEYGLTPDRMIDLKSLEGDTSDNIPGVPKVGEKTALKLIQDHGSLDGVYENIEKVKGALKDRLIEHKALAYLSRQLGTIHTDCDIECDLEACLRVEGDQAGLRDLYLECDFHTLAGAIEAPPAAPLELHYRTARTADDLDELIREIEGAELVSVDTETTSEWPLIARLVGVAISTRPHTGWYIPLAHRTLDAGEQLDEKVVLDRLRPALAKVKVCGQNLKYDYLVLKRHGLELSSIEFDSMIGSYLLNPTRRKHGLDELALEHLNRKMIAFKDLVGKDQDFSMVGVEAATRYSAEDADCALELTLKFRPQLDEQGLTDLFHTIEMPLVTILADMEEKGIGVDSDYLRQLGKELGDDIEAAARKIYELCGEECNLNSPLQLGKVLFEKLGLPVIKKTKSGYSTDQDVLQALEIEHGIEVAAWINRHRHLSKLKGTYVDSLPKLVNRETGKLHTSWNQTVAATGRLSSSDPNLQNIPIRTEVGQKIRRAFRADPGNLLVGFDYSQIELRILAHLAESSFLKEAFSGGNDVHRKTASRIFGVPEDEVSADLRSKAKAINFGILYGMSPFGLSREVGISQKEAKRFIESYFDQFPEVRGYIDRTLQKARDQQYVSTLLGRRRGVPQILSTNGAERGFAERIAINTPIQGSAADLIKKAMVVLHPRLAREIPRSKLLLQIHDELIFEVPEGEAPALTKTVKQAMESALSLDVPIVVNVHAGSTWADLK